MPIKVEFINDPIGAYTKVSVKGRTIAGITDLTPQDAVERFIKLCKENEQLLAHLTTRVEQRIRQNMALLDAGKEGKFWPEMRRLEQLKDKLLAEAGIVDS